MRTNLNVPYEQKDIARRLGAQWDIARKTWYIEDVTDIKQFMRWMPAHLTSPTKSVISKNATKLPVMSKKQKRKLAKREKSFKKIVANRIAREGK